MRNEQFLTLIRNQQVSAPVPEFDPTTIASLVFRSRYDVVFQDAAKTTPAIAADDPIGGWVDQKGGKDLTTTTVGLKPLLKIGVLNGHNVIRWDGVDDRLINATFALTQPLTIFIVGRISSTNAIGNTLIDSYNNTQAQVYGGYIGGGVTLGNFATSAGTLGTLFIPKNVGFNAHCIVFNGASSKHYLGPKYSITKSSGTNGFSGISAGQIRGNPNPITSVYPLGGDEAEIMLFSETLSDTDRNNLFSYAISHYKLRQVIFDGNSLTIGTGATAYTTDYPTQCAALLGTNYAAINFGVAGQTTPQMTADAVAQVDPLYSTPFSKILVAWEGTNDIVIGGADAATAYANLVTYCQARRAAGYKVIIVTVIKRGPAGAGFETTRNTLNANIVANWATFADGLADVGAAAQLQNSADTTYYNADGIHLNATGYGVVAAIVKTAVEAIG